MKVRVEEIAVGEFAGRVLYANSASWYTATMSCSTAEAAEALLLQFVDKLKTSTDFNSRKAQGKHIIKEWEV